MATLFTIPERWRWTPCGWIQWHARTKEYYSVIKKGDCGRWYKMDEPRRPYAKWNKAVTKTQVTVSPLTCNTPRGVKCIESRMVGAGVRGEVNVELVFNGDSSSSGDGRWWRLHSSVNVQTATELHAQKSFTIHVMSCAFYKIFKEVSKKSAIAGVSASRTAGKQCNALPNRHLPSGNLRSSSCSFSLLL